MRARDKTYIGACKLCEDGATSHASRMLVGTLARVVDAVDGGRNDTAWQVVTAVLPYRLTRTCRKS